MKVRRLYGLKSFIILEMLWSITTFHLHTVGIGKWVTISAVSCLELKFQVWFPSCFTINQKSFSRWRLYVWPWMYVRMSLWRSRFMWLKHWWLFERLWGWGIVRSLWLSRSLERLWLSDRWVITQISLKVTHVTKKYNGCRGVRWDLAIKTLSYNYRNSHYKDKTAWLLVSQSLAYLYLKRRSLYLAGTLSYRLFIFSLILPWYWYLFVLYMAEAIYKITKALGSTSNTYPTRKFRIDV